MTRYETIVSLGDNFVKLMGKNLIPIHILDWKVYYEVYLKELAANGTTIRPRDKSLAANVVADEYDISKRTMYNIIAFMEAN